MADGFKIADAYIEVEAHLDKAQFQRALEDVAVKVSPKVQQISRKTVGKSLVDGIGDAAGGGLLKSIGSAISGAGSVGMSALLSVGSVIGVTLGAAIAVAASGAVAAALTAGLALAVGGALIGLGAILLKDNKKLQDQFEKSWGNILKNLKKAAKPLLDPLIEGLATLDDIVRDLTPELKAMFKAVGPLVKILTDNLGVFLREIVVGITDAMPGITAAFQGFADALPGLGAAIGDLFREIFSNPDLINRLTRQLFDFVSFVIRLAGPAIQGLTVLWGALTNAIYMATTGWDRGLGALATAFDNFTNGGLSRIVAAWHPLWVAIQRVWAALEEFAAADTDEEIETKFQNLVARIKEAWGPLKGFLSRVWTEIWEAIKKYWNEKVIPWWNNTAKPEIKRVLGELADEAMSWMANRIKEGIKKSFENAKDWLKQAGANIILGLVTGIKSAIPGLQSLLNGITNMIPDWKGPMDVDRKLLVPTGRAIMGGLERGIQDGTGSLERTLGALTAAIPGMAAPAAAGGPPITLSFDGANFYGTPTREFIAMLYDLLDRYRKGYR